MVFPLAVFFFFSEIPTFLLTFLQKYFFKNDKISSKQNFNYGRKLYPKTLLKAYFEIKIVLLSVKM